MFPSILVRIISVTSVTGKSTFRMNISVTMNISVITNPLAPIDEPPMVKDCTALIRTNKLFKRSWNIGDGDDDLSMTIVYFLWVSTYSLSCISLRRTLGQRIMRNKFRGGIPRNSAAEFRVIPPQRLLLQMVRIL